MTQENLTQIDRDLVELLGKRIAALASSSLSLDEQSAHLSPLLSEMGVPEFVWKNILISCAAALATSPSHAIKMAPKKVTVVGGRGIIGRFFVDRLSAAGHLVNILEHEDWHRVDQIVADADLVIVSVPIQATLNVIQTLTPHLSPTTALADVTSIKAPFVKAMLEQHEGPVMGLHPMFGPGVTSFVSQRVVVCPGRQAEAFQWLLDLMTAEGGKLITCSPEEHDRMMTTVQVIRHFSVFSLGVFLSEEEIDVNRSLEFASPTYRLEIDMVSRLFAQNASLYLDIMLATEDRCEAIDRLVATYSRLAEMVKQKDKAALIQEFEAAQTAFKEEASRALEESDYVIRSLSTLLAAGEVEQRNRLVSSPS